MINIDSQFSINQPVEVVCEDSKCYGMVGYVIKTGNKECEVMFPNDYRTWFSDNCLIDKTKRVKNNV